MNTQLIQKLGARHINMIALSGSIGTGLFLVSGFAIATGGPGGALLAYVCMAIMVYVLMTQLAEMSAFKPSTGSFCDYATEFVGPSFGTAMGYNYWLSWTSAVAVEVLAASQLIGHWFPHLNPVFFTVLFFMLIVAANFVIVKLYGEIEFGLSLIKISAIVLFIILGLFSVITTPQFGVQQWQVSGAPFHHGIHGFLAVFLFVGLSFQGTELVGVASEETKDPEKTIPKAIKLVFWRLALFYILSILIITLLMPYNDAGLLSQDNVLTSPFTILFQSYMGHYAGDIVNFIIFIAVVSAANAGLYSSSRILWYLGKSGQAPLMLASVNQKGVPLTALFCTVLVAGCFILTSIFGSVAAFNYIVQLSSLSGFLVWLGIAFSHYQFRKKYLVNNQIQLCTLHYQSRFFPFTTVLAIVVIVAVICGQLFTLEVTQRDFSTLFITYFSLIIFSSIYFTHKLWVWFRQHKPLKH